MGLVAVIPGFQFFFGDRYLAVNNVLHALHQATPHDQVMFLHTQAIGRFQQALIRLQRGGLGITVTVCELQVFHQAVAHHIVATVQAETNGLAHQYFVVYVLLD